MAGKERSLLQNFFAFGAFVLRVSALVPRQLWAQSLLASSLVQGWRLFLGDGWWLAEPGWTLTLARGGAFSGSLVEVGEGFCCSSPKDSVMGDGEPQKDSGIAAGRRKGTAPRVQSLVMSVRVPGARTPLACLSSITYQPPRCRQRETHVSLGRTRGRTGRTRPLELCQRTSRSCFPLPGPKFAASVSPAAQWAVTTSAQISGLQLNPALPGTRLVPSHRSSLLSSFFRVFVLLCFVFEKNRSGVQVRFPNELLVGEGVCGDGPRRCPLFWDTPVFSA